MGGTRIDLFKELIKSEAFQFGIGDLSRMTGVSTRQLRYWEEKGIIDALDRPDENNARVYNFKAYVMVKSIKHFMDEGLTLRVAVERTAERSAAWHLWFQVVQEAMGDLTEIEEGPAVDMGFLDEDKTQHLYGILDDQGQLRYIVK
jgi:DNA-binding transcriptional MerR regulator